MIWRFTIIKEGVETVIDEPMQWDSIEKTIQRDSATHGMTFNFSTSNLEFSETAYWILKEEYLLYGVDGNIGLRIEWLCDDCEGWQLFYDGSFDFGRYKETCGQDCRIAIGVEESSTEVLITKRMDTDVDITSNLAYDNVTVLNNYEGLGNVITIPPKAVLLKAEGRISPPTEEDTGYNIIRDADFDYFDSNGAVQTGYIIPKFDNIVYAEIKDFTPGYATDYVKDLATSVPILDFKGVGIDSDANEFEFDFLFKGFIRVNANDRDGYLWRVKLSPLLPYGTNGNYQDLFAVNVIAEKEYESGGDPSTPHTEDIPFNFRYKGTALLNIGDKAFPAIKIETFMLTSSDFQPFNEISVFWDNESFFKINNKSVTKSTPATTFMLHETMSRIVEHITNKQYYFKSEYYGRIDSQPYSFPKNGCGGLRAVLNGLNIRNATLQDGSKPKVFLSLKDAYNSLDAMDCVGMGVEGKNVVVEPIKYFYSDEIMFVADGVDEITTSIASDRVYQQYNFGYDKYETESANGLDALHTKRQYRLQIKNTDAKLEKFSKIIADGYAIEATRRKFGSTEDWRYDQNIFMLCLTNGPRKITGFFTERGFFTAETVMGVKVGDELVITDSTLNNGAFVVDFVGHFFDGSTEILFTTPATVESEITITVSNLTGSTFYAVEQGAIDNPENMFDAATVINYGITPIRMALRWFKWVTQGYRNGGNLSFSSGEGNYVARGKWTSPCASEYAEVYENNNIDLETFNDLAESKPFIVPEKVSFTYPLGLNEFVDISAKKYGKIQFRRYETDPWQFGWIDTLRYNPNEGEANFNLITCKA